MKVCIVFIVVIGAIGSAVSARCQVFDSGSDGSDKQLNLTTPGISNFDPRDFHRDLGPQNEQVYRFTSITIGSGVVLKLSSKHIHGPIFWLSQGPVQIDGSIDLSGENGISYEHGGARKSSTGGAGGYSGGVGALADNSPQPGAGPHGGESGLGGGFSGNKLLIPLVGGSGGGGAAGASGGGGGGAILIASAVSIALNGKIIADGGNQTDPNSTAGGGGGGGIRLVAPLITGSGALLSAKGGSAKRAAASGQDGRIRLEAYQNQLRGDVNSTPLSVGKPFKLFLPPDPSPSVRVTTIDCVALQAAGTVGELPESALPRSGRPVVFRLEARQIKPGTVIKLHLYSSTEEDSTVDSTALIGTMEFSHATVTATLPNGFTQMSFEAGWKLDPLPVVVARVARPLEHSKTQTKVMAAK